MPIQEVFFGEGIFKFSSQKGLPYSEGEGVFCFLNPDNKLSGFKKQNHLNSHKKNAAKPSGFTAFWLKLFECKAHFTAKSLVPAVT